MMKSLNLFFMLAMVMALVAVTLSANTNETSDNGQKPAAASLRRPYTCEYFPDICYSQGLNCCNQLCVDFKTDYFNCGRCDHKCGYKKICCDGKCVNPLTNVKHCGFCYNDCGEGNSCVDGVCYYD